MACHAALPVPLPSACGGGAVYPGDSGVGDADGGVFIPADIVDEIAQEVLATTLYEEFAEEEVARGRPLPGLFSTQRDEDQRDFRVLQQGPP